MSLVPCIDLSDPDQWFEAAPSIILDPDQLLEYEMRPLRVCILRKDYKMLSKLWRVKNTWDQCHFYRMIELFNEQQDEAGLKSLLTPIDKYITHFFEEDVLHALIDESADMSDSFK